MKRLSCLVLVTWFVVVFAPVSNAELPWQYEQHQRYMVLGDSLGAGYGAMPQTQGYAYLLYQKGIFDLTTNTLFCNASVTGTTSSDVLAYQVPQAQIFHPDTVTLTVGGNDLSKILEGADPQTVLLEFQENLIEILDALVIDMGVRVYIANLYTIPQVPGADLIIPHFNLILGSIANSYGVDVADLYHDFLGKDGLLLIDRHGAEPNQIHPTNAGHRIITKSFETVIHP